MAASLVEGKKYGLNSKDSISGNKTVIHFKLTDSALRALEEFSKIKGCSRKTTIQFSDKMGVMSIPGQVSSDDPKAERRFQLNLSKNIGDANGSFDCVQQTRTRHGTGLSCLGSMQYKISTNANNDVYSDTRKKIAKADNESKKICAKEIKMSGRVSGKIKKVIPSSQFKGPNPGKSASSLPPSRHASSSHLSSSLQSQSSTSSASNHLSSSASSHNPASDSRSSSSSSLVNSSNGVVWIGNNPAGQNSRALTMPIRDRVVHLLALRSYKKAELVYRLMKDGIHSHDRDNLDSHLKSISVVNKGLKYSLHKDAWQYFRADWPLYSDTDRQLAKRNQQLAESRSSVSPSAASPAVRPADSPSPPQKRVSDEPPERIPSKRQRTSHPDEHPASRPNGKLPNGTLPNSALPLFSKNSYHQHNHRTSAGSTGSLSNSSESSIDSVSTIASSASDKDSPIPESPSSNCENQGKGDEHDSSTPDYLLSYCKIKTCDQRHRYKEDFNREYKEYRELHEKVEDVSRRFEHLKERIDNTQKGSERYQELRNMVLEEYKLHKSNTQFLSRKKRVDYLHNKLSHIKQLIMDYDRGCHVSHCS